MAFTYAVRDDAYQHSDIITILILGFCIDKNSLVAQLHGIIGGRPRDGMTGGKA